MTSVVVSISAAICHDAHAHVNDARFLHQSLHPSRLSQSVSK